MKIPFLSIQKLISRLLMTMACGVMMVSCDNLVYDDLEACEVEYRVKFRYDYNMKYADAFPHEVRSVTLFVFDENGRFVLQQTEKGDVLADKDYTMGIELLPGKYDFITWAGLENQESFTVPVLTEGVSTMQDLTCRMNREHVDGEDKVGYLQPLWHGTAELFVSESKNEAGTFTVVVPLIKDTNTIRIILQQLSDTPIDVDHFDFVIKDNNGYMAHDNRLLEDVALKYYPYHRATGSAEAGTQGDDLLNVAVAELSIGRLVETQNPQLTITNRENGEVVFSIPLIKYLSVCKTVANYDMALQEYLDREDEYVMHFFLDEDNEWINTQIIINDWIVRYNDITPEF